MSKINIIILLCFSGIMLTACSQDKTQEGLIFQISEDRITVVSEIDNVNIPYAQWFQARKPAFSYIIEEDTMIRDKNGKAMSIDELQVGHLVKVWNTGSAQESYPQQATAKKIIVQH